MDKAGNTIDFLLRAHINRHGLRFAVLGNRLEAPIRIRQRKYLNNVVEQDHRAIKRRTRPMLGFNNFRCERIILGGIAFMHMIVNGQMKDGGIAQTPAQQFYSLIA